MKTISGLFDSIVLQRNAKNRCDVTVHGEAAKGDLFFRAGKSRTWKKGGAIVRGNFRFKLQGLPAGGPYKIELEVRDNGKIIDRLTVKDVLVGDVWVCAGQSNMQGYGLLKYAAPPHPKVRAFYMNDRWGIAKDPIHNMWATVDRVHVDLCGVLPIPSDWGTGPAVEFGREMWRRTGVPQGLLACAHGGTSMTLWNPDLYKAGTHSLYGAAVRRICKNGGRIAGVLWYQGESETNAKDAPLFTDRMRRLIKAFRRDAQSPRLPFVMVQLARVIIDPRTFDATTWNSVQDQQRRLQQLISNVAVVPAVDLQMDDQIHISGKDMRRLGGRLAQAMHALQGGHKTEPLPIVLQSVKVERNSVTGYGNIRFRFDHVMGKLCSNGLRPMGFSVINTPFVPCMFDTELKGKEVILRTTLYPDQLEGYNVHYGHGTDPACNISDEAERALPVFGPIVLPRTRALTPFANNTKISKILSSDRFLHKLRLPKTFKKNDWENLQYAGAVNNVWERFQNSPLSDKYVFFHWKLKLSEPMKLAALLGYDGPVKLWVDGKMIFHDPKGRRPFRADAQQPRFSAKKGTRNVVMAFGAGDGNAIGISLRFERLDVTTRLLQEAKVPLPLVS